MTPGAPKALLSEKEVAAYLKLSVKTLQLWRYQGKGPAYCKVGRCVRYRPEDVAAFVAAHRMPTGSPPEAFARPRCSLRVAAGKEVSR